jgi:hypothetical protein
VAYVQQADALVAEMKTSRTKFWRAQLEVVDALLANASDKVAHRVQVRLAAAKVAFEDKYGSLSDEIRELAVSMEPRFDESEESLAECPACGSPGVAGGDIWLDEVVSWDNDPNEPNVWGGLQFTATSFSCQHCGLRLASREEIAAAGMPAHWEFTGIDLADYVGYLEEAEAARRDETSAAEWDAVPNDAG